MLTCCSNTAPCCLPAVGPRGSPAQIHANIARMQCRSDKEAASERSIPGLMAALERGEMPAAQQPPGLTVQVGAWPGLGRGGTACYIRSPFGRSSGVFWRKPHQQRKCCCPSATHASLGLPLRLSRRCGPTSCRACSSCWTVSAARAASGALSGKCLTGCSAGVLPAVAAAGDLLLAGVDQRLLWILPSLLAADAPMPQASPPLPRRLFWQRMTTPNGTRYWWSHLLGRASVDVPAQGWGGWCAEEMGLGKVRRGGLWRGAGAARPQTPIGALGNACMGVVPPC